MNKVILTSLAILVGTSVFAANGGTVPKAAPELTHFSDGSYVSCTAHHADFNINEDPKSLLLDTTYKKVGSAIMAYSRLLAAGKLGPYSFESQCNSDGCEMFVRNTKEKVLSIINTDFRKSDHAIQLQVRDFDNNTTATLVCTKVRRGSF